MTEEVFYAVDRFYDHIEFSIGTADDRAWVDLDSEDCYSVATLIEWLIDPSDRPQPTLAIPDPLDLSGGVAYCSDDPDTSVPAIQLSIDFDDDDDACVATVNHATAEHLANVLIAEAVRIGGCSVQETDHAVTA